MPLNGKLILLQGILGHINDIQENPLEEAELMKFKLMRRINEKEIIYTINNWALEVEPGWVAYLIPPQRAPQPERENPREAQQNPEAPARAGPARGHLNPEQRMEGNPQQHPGPRVENPLPPRHPHPLPHGGINPFREERLPYLPKDAKWVDVKYGGLYGITGFKFRRAPMSKTRVAPEKMWERCIRRYRSGEEELEEFCYMYHYRFRGKTKYVWTRDLVKN
jgi:hypothetical protein